MNRFWKVAAVKLAHGLEDIRIPLHIRTIPEHSEICDLANRLAANNVEHRSNWIYRLELDYADAWWRPDERQFQREAIPASGVHHEVLVIV